MSMSCMAFRERAVKVLRDLAEFERLAHRHHIDTLSMARAEAFERAADMVSALAEAPPHAEKSQTASDSPADRAT